MNIKLEHKAEWCWYEQYFIMDGKYEVGDIWYKKLDEYTIDIFLLQVDEERQGIGSAVMNILKNEYDNIYIKHPAEEVIGFWKKMWMKKEGDKYLINK